MVKFILGLEVVFFAFCAVALVYFIFKRIREKEEESFEDRDN